MTQMTTTMDIFMLLNKSNCRKCNETTCLAFAAAVFKGIKELGECPELDSEIVEHYGGRMEKPKTPEDDAVEAITGLKDKIKSLDLSKCASRLDGRYGYGKLTLKILGKNFSVDALGNFYTDMYH